MGHLPGRVGFELFHKLEEFAVVVSLSEDTLFLGESAGFHVDRSHLVWEVVLLLEKGSAPVERILSVCADSPGLDSLETAEKGQQGGLADSVLSQQTIDLPFFQGSGYAF